MKYDVSLGERSAFGSPRRQQIIPANDAIFLLPFSPEEARDRKEHGRYTRVKRRKSASKERKIGIFAMAITIELRENGKFKSADRRDEYGCRVGARKTRRRDLCDANFRDSPCLY